MKVKSPQKDVKITENNKKTRLQKDTKRPTVTKGSTYRPGGARAACGPSPAGSGAGSSLCADGPRDLQEPPCPCASAHPGTGERGTLEGERREQFKFLPRKTRLRAKSQSN